MRLLRSARWVVHGVAQHITQRGVDRQTCLRLLREQSGLSGLAILTYCLMPNHIHLVAVPPDEEVLAEVMQRVHGRYAQCLNERRSRCCHLWQNRFNSCALGATHLSAALRYVALNPVRARLVASAAQYAWSSAEAHLSGQDRRRIVDMRFWLDAGGAEAWRRLLAEPEEEAEIKALRRATYAGQPLGNEGFVEKTRTERSAGCATVVGETISPHGLPALRTGY